MTFGCMYFHGYINPQNYSSVIILLKIRLRPKKLSLLSCSESDVNIILMWNKISLTKYFSYKTLFMAA